MTYQPLYATVTDNQVGDGHTSSRRGKVTQVHADINTHFGKCIDVGAFSEGSLPRKDEQYAVNKVAKWKLQGNVKKEKEWIKKLEYYQAYNKEQESKERVEIGISISPREKKFKYSINGIGFSLDEFESFHEVYHQNRPLFNKIKLANEIEKQAEEGKQNKNGNL